MTSKKQSAKSDEGQDRQITNSVFDFLYHDGRRVASFLAQFDPSGSLTQISQGTAAEKSRQDSHKLEGGGSIGVAKATTSNAGEVRHRRQDEITRVYDPTWANARSFLDLTAEAGLIQPDVSAAAVGQLVLCKGSLTVKDLQLMTNLWGLPSAKQLIAAGLKQAVPPALGRGAKANPVLKQLHDKAVGAAQANRQGLELFLDFVPTLPHTVQATISGEEDVWCSLLREGLTFDPTDIILKFSERLPGEWAAIGILDALPDEPPSNEIKKVDYLSGAAIAKLGDAIAPMVRMSLGRPYQAYGITPLLIFREVTAR